MFEKEDYLIKFDLKLAYHHLDIFEAHQTCVPMDCRPESQIFCVYSFAIWVGHCLLSLYKIVVACYWVLGLRALLYLDDGIMAARSLEASNCMSMQVQQDLVKAVLLANEAKFQWEPVSKLTWLGFEINLETGQVIVPDNKLVCLCELLQSLLE